LNITKAIIAFLVALIIISGIVCLWQENESTPESTKNNIEKNADEKLGWEPVFAIIGFLAVACLVLRGRK
jgi:hypothetical protein